MNTNKSAPEKRSCCELTPSEKEALRHIFKAILESGKAPTTEELRVSLKESAHGVIRVLDKLEEK